MPKLSWKLRAGERSTEIDNDEGEIKAGGGRRKELEVAGAEAEASPRGAGPAAERQRLPRVRPPARPRARRARLGADSHGRTAEPLSQLLPVGGFGAAREVPSCLRREGRNRTVQITGHDRDGPLGAAGTSLTLQRKRARGFGLPSVAYK